MSEKNADGGINTASRIFKTVWKHPRSSRVAIAERLGLDKSTITNQVNHLIDIGLLEEIEEGSSTRRGGRRPIHLGIRKSFGRIIGVEIQAENYVVVEVDLSGAILGERRGSARFSTDSMSEIIRGIVNESPADTSGGAPVLGVGVGTGGLVDLKKSRIRFSVPLGISEPVDFGQTLAERISLPCFIENDANCCAWGELAFSRSEELRNFLFVLVEYRRDPKALEQFGGLGVGCGIVLGGKVYSGSHGNAGEFRSAFCDGHGELQFSLSKRDLGRLTQDSTVLERAADELARNLAMFSNMMDFDSVVIGGDIEEFGIDLPTVLGRRLEENWMYPIQKKTEIRYSKLGARAVAYGAAGMMLDRLANENLIPGLDAARPPSS